MGCTLEAVLCVGRNAIVYHVGDSRVYHKSGTTIRQLTVDQTFVNKLLERGEITQEEAENHPYRAAVVQAIGAQAGLEPAFYQAQIQAGDWLLVCTDGVSNHINLQEFNLIFSHCINAEQAARRIVNLAVTRGGYDNATAVVVAAR
jgi:protein phosphatase